MIPTINYLGFSSLSTFHFGWLLISLFNLYEFLFASCENISSKRNDESNLLTCDSSVFTYCVFLIYPLLVVIHFLFSLRFVFHSFCIVNISYFLWCMSNHFFFFFFISTYSLDNTIVFLWFMPSKISMCLLFFHKQSILFLFVIMLYSLSLNMY